MLLIVLLLAAGLAWAGGKQEEGAAAGETVSADFWTHWCSNNEHFEPFWVEAAAKFSAEHPEVKLNIKLNCVPYEGYEAKYSSAFDAGKGPGMFNAMTHVWTGQFGVTDPMPEDIAAKANQLIVQPSARANISRAISRTGSSAQPSSRSLMK
jgi:ABC-type glycerol-3-phosphate transport system substrate-binding protein